MPATAGSSSRRCSSSTSTPWSGTSATRRSRDKRLTQDRHHQCPADQECGGHARRAAERGRAARRREHVRLLMSSTRPGWARSESEPWRGRRRRWSRVRPERLEQLERERRDRRRRARRCRPSPASIGMIAASPAPSGPSSDLEQRAALLVGARAREREVAQAPRDHGAGRGARRAPARACRARRSPRHRPRARSPRRRPARGAAGSSAAR